MTQSCDLSPRRAVKRVMVCPVWKAREFLETFPAEQRKDKRNKLNADQLGAYHVLSPCTIKGIDHPHLVVDFVNAFSIERDYALELAAESSPRARLLPPYREYMAQAFARYFMRIGLPIDREPIPEK